MKSAILNRKSSSLRIGTRKSKLALWQANWVADQLKKYWPDLIVELVPMTTTGDEKARERLSDIGGKALFTKEIEEALLDCRIDLAVHSLKDMATDLPRGLTLAVTPLREDPHDVLISKDLISFKELKSGTRIGTSSLRRKCQLKARRPDLVYDDLRGNVDTRLQKMRAGEFGAIVLAAAGLKRLGLSDQITEVLDLIPAVGQGALALEAREGDEATRRLIGKLDDPETHLCIDAERAFLKVMEGGCQVPLACHAVCFGDQIHLRAFVSDLEGKRVITRTRQVPRENVVSEAQSLADEMLDAGGREILERLRT